MKEDSKWPMGSYIASIIGAAAVTILKLYAAQRGASHFSGARLLPGLLAISPFLFGGMVLGFNDNPRAVKYLSLAIILQSALAIFGYYRAIFVDVGLEGSLDLGLVPLYQFAFLAVVATAVRFMDDKKSRGIRH